MVFYDTLHQRLAEACLQGSETLHGGWQLTMVAGENHSRHATDGNPTGCFKGLGCLVDEKGAEFLTFEQTVGRAHKGTRDDAGLAEELGIDADLQFCGTFFQTFEFLMVAVAATLPIAPEIPDSFPDAPEEGVVGMGLEATFVGETEHLVVDTGGITDT